MGISPQMNLEVETAVRRRTRSPWQRLAPIGREQCCKHGGDDGCAIMEKGRATGGGGSYRVERRTCQTPTKPSGSGARQQDEGSVLPFSPGEVGQKAPQVNEPERGRRECARCGFSRPRFGLRLRLHTWAGPREGCAWACGRGGEKSVSRPASGWASRLSGPKP
jgi:hypothetical protein